MKTEEDLVASSLPTPTNTPEQQIEPDKENLPDETEESVQNSSGPVQNSNGPVQSVEEPVQNAAPPEEDAEPTLTSQEKEEEPHSEKEKAFPGGNGLIKTDRIEENSEPPPPLPPPENEEDLPIVSGIFQLIGKGISHSLKKINY